MHAGGAPPRVDARLRAGEVEQVLELLGGPSDLALRGELGGDGVTEVDEHLDVEGGIQQPRLGQRPHRPVDGGVLLGQLEAEVVLDHRAEPDAGQPGETPAELGVEERPRTQADLGQARKVLGGGVQDPLGVADGLADGGEVGTGDGVDEPGAGALAPDLDEVGALAVAVARRPLGVDAHRARARPDRLGGAHQRALVDDDVGHAVTRVGQGDEVRDVARRDAGGVVEVVDASRSALPSPALPR